jgi:hypothetical protein
MLQSKAGYIDARPHIPHLEEVLLQRTAGPYMWVISRHNAIFERCPLCPREQTSTALAGHVRLVPILLQKSVASFFGR